ncbi:thymidylate synthase (FAD) [Peptoniphilus ivorii]|uniref:FAD-dependent thymidylate synthase n=1 Tax=Aedoeadaptatus ivorii TaxID=54006 RepID=UPI00277E88AA|nr:FAD-dependent thymidylate synthase [Peptoniphilus ivorii]MDQ0508302.1 thymidylate synthase (FAD) [Peptoniphilus ivorii]
MKVKLIGHTPDAQELIAKAAKLCYSPVGVDEIEAKLDDEETERFVGMLAGLSHLSPLEHASFTFAVEGVSRVMTHQLVRHRIASYSQQSQRYVRLDAMEYITPPAIRDDAEAAARFQRAMQEAESAYRELTDRLRGRYERALTEAGEDEKAAARKAEKRAIEDARYVLPNACETKIVVTMNARTLLHFFETRLCLRAQWEIREVALAMLKAVLSTAPALSQKAGPPCVQGPCPEGKMTCGKIDSVRKMYREEIWKRQ